jgi:GNAT superfamily N-acetyltransferase
VVCRGIGRAQKEIDAVASPSTGSDPVLRAARPEDCRRIAELFEISSDGVADYVWSRLQEDYPGLSLLEIGERRYARENTGFSYQNCVVAERAGEVIGMLHAFVIEPAAGPSAAADIDPVLRPYAELEVPGSLYISGLALVPGERGRGVGTRLLEIARERARAWLPGAEPDLPRRQRGCAAPLRALWLHGDRSARYRAASHDPRHRRGLADEGAGPMNAARCELVHNGPAAGGHTMTKWDGGRSAVGGSELRGICDGQPKAETRPALEHRPRLRRRTRRVAGDRARRERCRPAA